MRKTFAVVIITFFIMVVVLTSLASCKGYLPPSADPIVDCVNADQARIKSLLDSFWPSSGAKPDFGKIEAAAIDAGVSIGGCAIAAFVQKYLAPPMGTAVPPPGLANAARDTLERFRGKHANGALFRFKDGDL
jgi:hypothetical protein